MLDGQGSFLSGGRYNAAESFPAVYASSIPELSLSEAIEYKRKAGLPVSEALPVITKGVAVGAVKVLDLVSPGTQTALGVTLADLTADDWTRDRFHGRELLTQAIGRAVHEVGLDGLLAPSALSRGTEHNVILFPNTAAAKMKIRQRPRKP